MFKSSRHKRKPDFLMLLTIFVCLGVVLTTTVSADEPAKKGWGIQVSAEHGCQQADAEWLTCGKWQEGVQQSGVNETIVPQRAALRLGSERLPDTGLVAYYSFSNSGQYADIGYEPRFNLNQGFSDNQDPRQFGMALRQEYGGFGLSLGFEADRVGDLTNDPLIYFGVSNRW